jgi:hypothetical protein
VCEVKRLQLGEQRWLRLHSLPRGARPLLLRSRLLAFLGFPFPPSNEVWPRLSLSLVSLARALSLSLWDDNFSLSLSPSFTHCLSFGTKIVPTLARSLALFSLWFSLPPSLSHTLYLNLPHKHTRIDFPLPCLSLPVCTCLSFLVNDLAWHFDIFPPGSPSSKNK